MTNPKSKKSKSETGSDAQFKELGKDTRQVAAEQLLYEQMLDEEEERLQNTSPAENEPGEDYPDPDETPPMDEEHDEFDPEPPPAPTT